MDEIELCLSPSDESKGGEGSKKSLAKKIKKKMKKEQDQGPKQQSPTLKPPVVLVNEATGGDGSNTNSTPVPIPKKVVEEDASKNVDIIQDLEKLHEEMQRSNTNTTSPTNDAPSHKSAGQTSQKTSAGQELDLVMYGQMQQQQQDVIGNKNRALADEMSLLEEEEEGEDEEAQGASFEVTANAAAAGTASAESTTVVSGSSPPPLQHKIIESPREENPEKKEQRRRQRRRRMETCLLLLLLAAAGATMILLGVRYKRNQNESNAVTSGTGNDAGSGGNTSSQGQNDDPQDNGTGGGGLVVDVDGQENINPPPAEPEVVIKVFAQPDPAIAHVTPFQSQFQEDQDVSLYFSIGQDTTPTVNDWIGLYKLGQSADPDNYAAFSYVCEVTSTIVFTCDQPLNTINATVTFDQDTVELSNGVGAWPLETGAYEAFLYRGVAAPYTILAKSFIFAITGAPSNAPTSMPSITPNPSPAPTSEPSKRPSPPPTDVPVVPSNVPERVAETSDMIRSVIGMDAELGPKFVRLGFHDCVGGCDGCVDMNNADNAGLLLPIAALQPIVDASILSRADVWALAALVAADVAQSLAHEDLDDVDFEANFNMEWVGRLNCEDREVNGICFDADGEVTECSATAGPHRHLPAADITTADLFQFFDDEFGFGVEETVALMGAHTLGSLSADNSGFDGPNGWVRDNLFLDNDYYHELVGGDSMDDDVETWIEDAPRWVRSMLGDEDEGVTPRFAWLAFPSSPEFPFGERIVMLNADIALVRDINADNFDPESGVVACAFVNAVVPANSDNTRCPHAEESLEFAAQYKFDNSLWLADFEAVYKKMLVHGYSQTDGTLCPLNNPKHPRCYELD